MSVQHVCVLLALLGGALLVLSWVGRRTGDAPRDVALMSTIGAVMALSAAVLHVAA